MLQSKGAERQRLNELSRQVIGACIEVHRQLGPGLLEGIYEECLCHELQLRSLPFVRQVALPVQYKGVKLDGGYRIDLVVGGGLVVELKTVDELLPVHQAQLLTYLKLSGLSLGLLVNFNSAVLRQGIRRVVLGFPDE